MTITLSGTPVIHTKRLILRAPEPWDCAPFCAFMASDRARFVGGTTEPGRAWRAFGAILGHWVMRGFGPFTIVRADGRTGQKLRRVTDRAGSGEVVQEPLQRAMYTSRREARACSSLLGMSRLRAAYRDGRCPSRPDASACRYVVRGQSSRRLLCMRET